MEKVKSNNIIYICEKEKLTNLTLIHYGSKIYAPKLFLPIQNRLYFCKPKGGLWTSPINSNWGWKDWCTSENFSECNEENSFKLFKN
ncbi:MAG: hypothetical protein M0R17_06335 [Candidatus Omnitrophica bacterium]|jgi:hypothetical protein|nr:hypothetical protein [Candidatus Omnitrophota bacterium]